MSKSSTNKPQPAVDPKVADEFGSGLVRYIEQFANAHPKLSVTQLIFLVIASYDWLGKQLEEFLKRQPRQ